MKQNQILDRINKVLNSCKTEDQLNIASKYCEMLVKYFYKKTCGLFDTSYHYSTEANELFSLVRDKTRTLDDEMWLVRLGKDYE